MTTADYLESLQNDLATIKSNLSEGGMSIDDGDDFSSIATKTVGIQVGGTKIPVYYIASNKTNVSRLPDNGYFINYSGIGNDQTTELTAILNDFASTGAPMMQLVVYTTAESGTGYTTNAVIYNSFGKLRETSANVCVIGEVFNTGGTYKTLHRVNIYYTYSNGTYTCTETSTNTIKVPLAQKNDVLTKTNTTSYTPSADYHPATKKYVDDNKGQTIQYGTMPTAGSNLEGKIVQYIGTTDSTYANGYFYKCVSDGEETPTYSWEEIEVQGGGDLSNYYTKSETQALRNVFAYNLSSGDLLTSNSFTHTITDTNFLDFFNANENKPMSLILSDMYGNAAFIPFATYTNTKALILSDAQNDWIGSRLIRINRTKTSGKITSVTITTNSYPFSGVVKYALESNVLLKNNTSSFTPSGDYNPATKKYVDDTTNVNVITSSTSTYTISSLVGNTAYKLGEITALTITTTTTFDKESVIYFESGTTATVVSLPSTITNLGDVPTMTETSGVNSGTCTASKNYIIAIQNNIAVWKEY